MQIAETRNYREAVLFPFPCLLLSVACDLFFSQDCSFHLQNANISFWYCAQCQFLDGNLKAGTTSCAIQIFFSDKGKKFKVHVPTAVSFTSNVKISEPQSLLASFSNSRFASAWTASTTKVRRYNAILKLPHDCALCLYMSFLFRYSDIYTGIFHHQDV